MQHKSLLLFIGKKVIVAKVKLCCEGDGNHDDSSDCSVAVKIIAWGLYKCKVFFRNGEKYRTKGNIFAWNGKGVKICSKMSGRMRTDVL